MTAAALRIVSLDAGLTEILFALGLERRVVGVSEESDFPIRARAKERVGPGASPDAGKILALRPTLVLALLPAQEQAAGRLSGEGLPVKTVAPATLEDLCNAVMDIGSWTEREADAYRIVTAIRSPLQRMQQARASKPRMRVYVEENSTPPRAAGLWTADLMKACNAEAMTASGDLPRPAELEAMRRFDPDVLVFLRPEGREYEAPNPALRKGWEGLRACASGRLRYLPEEIFMRPGPRLVEGARRVARLIDELSG
jgi:iron complex transport system substrate-binding protein